jgi:hypothetical protein
MRGPARAAVVAGGLLALAFAASAGATTEESQKPKKVPTAPILTVMNSVVDRLAPKFLSRRGEGPRVSVAHGVFGLGTYAPRGGADWGVAAPPLQVFPRAGLGTSLNLDPVTGKIF